MTRPKSSKSRSRGGGGTPTAQAAAAAAAAAGGGGGGASQQLQHQQQGARKRPAGGGDGGGAGSVGGAAAALEQPEVDQLERKRMQVAEELRQVEKQIFDLETNYFQVSSAMGNAIRGYEGFLGASKRSAPPVQPEERLFSWSSITGQVGTGAGGE